jgi:hypothetical protein
LNQKESFISAKENYHKALNGEYIDVHFSLFTPESFFNVIIEHG